MPLEAPTPVFIAVDIEQYAAAWRKPAIAAIEADDATLLRHLLGEIETQGQKQQDPKREKWTGLTRLLLMLAAERGAVECVKTLLPLADPFVVVGGRNALLLAADGGHLGCLQSILGTAQPQTVGEHCRAALRIVSSKGALECVRWLLATGDADVAKTGHEKVRGNVYSDQAQTPLYLAVEQGRLECIRALLPHSDASWFSESGRTPLMQAAFDANVEAVRLLLSRSPLSHQDAEGMSALMLAVAPRATGFGARLNRRHQLACAKLLLHAQPELALECNHEGFTPLLLAARHADPDLLQELWSRSQPETLNKRGQNVLHCAAQSGREDNVQTVLWLVQEHVQKQKGAQEQEDTEECASVSTSVTQQKRQTKSDLEGADEDEGEDEDNRTAIPSSQANRQDGADPFKASNVRQKEPLTALSLGLAQDRGGWSALMYVAQKGKVESVRRLLPFSNPKALDSEGMSVLMHAAQSNSQECVGVLIGVSDVLATNPQGKRASDLAEEVQLEPWFKKHQPSAARGDVQALLLAAEEQVLLKQALVEGISGSTEGALSPNAASLAMAAETEVQDSKRTATAASTPGARSAHRRL